MTTLVALDPGIRGVGVALLVGERLAACDYLASPVKKGDTPAAVLAIASTARAWVADHLWKMTPARYPRDVFAVIEWPQVYTASKSAGDNNDLLPLAGVGSAFLALLGTGLVERVRPHEWKGQLDKDATEARVLKRLDAYERLVWEHARDRAKSKAHNMTDAVGIGLHAVGRFDPVRVISRGRQETP